MLQPEMLENQWLHTEYTRLSKQNKELEEQNKKLINTLLIVYSKLCYQPDNFVQDCYKTILATISDHVDK